MKKILTYLFVLILLLTTVSALETREAEEVSITKEVNENLYTAGGTVSIDAPVNGDITAFGGELSINSPVAGNIMACGGNVNINSPIKEFAHVCGGDVSINSVIGGDLMSCGGNININENVSGDLRAMGGNINIEGNVKGDVLAMGGNININKDVEGEISAKAGAISINNVAGDVEFTGGEITIDGIIEGNVEADATSLKLKDNAIIKGNLTYTSQTKAVLKREQVKGSIFKKTVKKKAPTYMKQINFKIFYGLSLLLVGIILVLIMPSLSNTVANNIKIKPWKSLLFGLLALIVTPIAAALIMVTIIGIPIAIILFLLYALAVFLSKIFAALYIGKLFFKGKKLVAAVVVGLIIYIILANIPYIGGLVKVVALLLGLGAITIMIFTKKRKKK